MTDGWRYADMPHDGDAWRASLAALDDDARRAHDGPFADLDVEVQRDMVQSVQDRIDQVWHDLPARHVWSLRTRYACAAFYSHPWAWNDIASGARPTPGLQERRLNAREPWERSERDARDRCCGAKGRPGAGRSRVQAFRNHAVGGRGVGATRGLRFVAPDY